MGKGLGRTGCVPKTKGFIRQVGTRGKTAERATTGRQENLDKKRLAHSTGNIGVKPVGDKQAGRATGQAGPTSGSSSLAAYRTRQFPLPLFPSRTPIRRGRKRSGQVEGRRGARDPLSVRTSDHLPELALGRRLPHARIIALTRP